MAARKVLLMTGWYFPDSIGGTETYVSWLAADLRSMGYDVRIAAPSGDGREKSYEYDGIPVYRYPVSLHPSRREVAGEIEPVHFDAFKRWASGCLPDIVHFHSYGRGCGQPHAEFFHAAGVPVIATVHTPLFNCARGTMTRWGSQACDGVMRPALCGACYLQSRGMPRALSWIAALAPTPPDWAVSGRLRTTLQIRRTMRYRTRSVERFFEITEHVIVVCHWLREALKKNGVPDEKLTLIKHGLPGQESMTTRVISEGFTRIGYLGRLHPSKGVDILIEAFSRLPLSVNAQLHIYGGAHDEPSRKYEKRLHLLGDADKRIIFHGAVPQAQVAGLLRELDVLAVPSIWMETGPLVALQAFSVGTPVIGSALGSIIEIVTEGVNGLIVPPKDVEAWSRALGRVATDHGLLQRMSDCRPEVKSSLEVAQKTAVLYEKTLSKKSGGIPWRA